MSNPPTPPTEPEFSVSELSLGHQAWYWVHHRGEERRCRFWQHRGRLLRGEEKRTVGVNLSNRETALWVDAASADELETIRTAKASGPDAIDQLKRLPGLEALECSDLTARQLRTVCRLGASLKCLYLSWCEDLAGLEALADLKGLLRAVLADCQRVADVTPFTALPHLRRLDIINCDGIRDIKPLGELKRVVHLVLRNCDSIDNLHPVAGLANLTILDISRCDSVHQLNPLAQLKRLRILDISETFRVVDISPLAEVPLVALTMFGCTNIESLAPVHGMKHLRKVCLPAHTTDGDLLAVCVSHPDLDELDLRGCTEILDLAPLQHMPGLKRLNIGGCRGITTLAPLSDLHELTRLDMSLCSGVTDLMPLSGLRELRDLFVGGCMMLRREDVNDFVDFNPECTVHSV